MDRSATVVGGLASLQHAGSTQVGTKPFCAPNGRGRFYLGLTGFGLLFLRERGDLWIQVVGATAILIGVFRILR